jgi:hypothetical protein
LAACFFFKKMTDEQQFKKPRLEAAMAHIQAQYKLDQDFGQYQNALWKMLEGLDDAWRMQCAKTYEFQDEGGITSNIPIDEVMRFFKFPNPEYDWERDYDKLKANIKPTAEKSFDGATAKNSFNQYSTADEVVLLAGNIKGEVVETGEKPKERWKPKEGEFYWIVSVVGEASKYRWCGDGADRGMLAFGNVFPSEQAAIEARDKVKSLLLSL